MITQVYFSKKFYFRIDFSKACSLCPQNRVNLCNNLIEFVVLRLLRVTPPPGKNLLNRSQALKLYLEFEILIRRTANVTVIIIKSNNFFSARSRIISTSFH